jgi:hypothetical protein
MEPRMRTMTSLAVMAVALCGFAFASCGGGNAEGDGGSSASDSSDDARLEFAECMRKHGVDVPDPQPGERSIQLGGPDAEGRGDLLNDPDAKDAFDACQEKLGDFGPENLSAEQRQELQDAALRYAECMRDHGVDVPDPQFGSGPGGGGGILFQGKVDTDSPAFREASEACEDKLPRPPGEGPGSSS